MHLTLGVGIPPSGQTGNCLSGLALGARVSKVSPVRRGAITAIVGRCTASSDGLQWWPASEVAREVGGERGTAFQVLDRVRARSASQKSSPGFAVLPLLSINLLF